MSWRPRQTGGVALFYLDEVTRKLYYRILLLSGRLYVMLHHDLVGLGNKGQIVTKEAFDAFVREQIDYLARFVALKHASTEAVDDAKDAT